MRSIAWQVRGVAFVLFGLGLGVATWSLATLGAGWAGWGVVLVVVVVASLLVGALVEMTVLRPLATLKETIEAMCADGDLTRRVPVSSDDEVGGTAAAYNKMVASIQTIIGKVFFNAMEVARASHQVFVESGQVADGSTRQHNAAQATANAMGGLTGAMHEVSQHAHETAAISQSASEVSREGVLIVNDASREMEKISRSVTQSSEVVRVLGERSHAISGIVQTIREIADQTNLLALNAAIEAARAGEHGMGFAVVADEVRKLAERSNQAAREISTLIKESTKRVEEGAQLSDQTGGSLKQIITAAQATAAKIAEIASATAG